MTQDHYHFIGIGGIGMSGLARLLKQKNLHVSGSDIAVNKTIESLIQLGIDVYKGHHAKNILPHYTIIYSSDIQSHNVEYQRAIELNCALLHRSQLLHLLIQDKQSIAVAGTHGKTTTSSLLAAVCVEGGLEASFAVGGVVANFSQNAQGGTGKTFIFEADESDGTFLNYHPFGAIVTNVDSDHLVNYQNDFTCLKNAFKTFASQVQSLDHLFWCGDDEYLPQLIQGGQRYGFHDACEWRITRWYPKEFHLMMDIQHQGYVYPNIEVALSGKHNALNAAAVFGIALSLGVKEEKIRHSFKTFKGIGRRCEKKGSFQTIQLIDDYAHHPTEIQATLEAIRQAEPTRKLIAVFQPHRYSRIQECFEQFEAVFDAADHLIVTDIYAAGEEPLIGITSQNLLKKIQQTSQANCCYISRPALTHYLSHILQANDLFVTLGAGDITHVGLETFALMEKNLVNCSLQEK